MDDDEKPYASNLLKSNGWCNESNALDMSVDKSLQCYNCQFLFSNVLQFWWVLFQYYVFFDMLLGFY